MTTIDPLQFNISADNGWYHCPCCGWDGTFSVEAYDKHGGMIGRGLCSCCYWEPGFDDDPMASAAALATIRESLLTYRRAWVESGYIWRSSATVDPPNNWKGREQLATLLKRAPHLMFEGET
jgi:hypothetical protein